MRPRAAPFALLILIICISTVQSFVPVHLQSFSALARSRPASPTLHPSSFFKSSLASSRKCTKAARYPQHPLMMADTGGGSLLNSFQEWVSRLLFRDTLSRSDAPLTIVTGGNRGIGLAIARHVGELGHNVVIACRSQNAGEEAEAVLRGEGIEVVFHQLDVTKRSEIRSLVQQCASSSNDLRTPSYVFNNAGVCIEGASLETLQQTMEVNYWGPVHMIEAFRSVSPPLDSKSPPPIEFKPTVINISSGEGELVYLCTALQDMLSSVTSVSELNALVRGLTDGTILGGTELAYGPTPAYSVSKAALNAFTRIVGSEISGLEAADARDQMRIVAVCPGDVDTRMSSDWQGELLLSSPSEATAPRCNAAADIVWAATHPALCQSGYFYRAREQITW